MRSASPHHVDATSAGRSFYHSVVPASGKSDMKRCVATPRFILISRPLAAHQRDEGGRFFLLVGLYGKRCACVECNTPGRKSIKHNTTAAAAASSGLSGWRERAVCSGYRGERSWETSTYLTVSPDVVLFRLSEQSHLSGLCDRCAWASP